MSVGSSTKASAGGGRRPPATTTKSTDTQKGGVTCCGRLLGGIKLLLTIAAIVAVIFGAISIAQHYGFNLIENQIIAYCATGGGALFLLIRFAIYMCSGGTTKEKAKEGEEESDPETPPVTSASNATVTTAEIQRLSSLLDSERSARAAAELQVRSLSSAPAQTPADPNGLAAENARLQQELYEARQSATSLQSRINMIEHAQSSAGANDGVAAGRKALAEERTAFEQLRAQFRNERADLEAAQQLLRQQRTALSAERQSLTTAQQTFASQQTEHNSRMSALTQREQQHAQREAQFNADYAAKNADLQTREKTVADALALAAATANAPKPPSGTSTAASVSTKDNKTPAPQPNTNTLHDPSGNTASVVGGGAGASSVEQLKTPIEVKGKTNRRNQAWFA